MPLSVLTRDERQDLLENIGLDAYHLAEENGLTVAQRLHIELRDTDHAAPQARSYRRGNR